MFFTSSYYTGFEKEHGWVKNELDCQLSNKQDQNITNQKVEDS